MEDIAKGMLIQSTANFSRLAIVIKTAPYKTVFNGCSFHQFFVSDAIARFLPKSKTFFDTLWHDYTREGCQQRNNLFVFAIPDRI